MKQSIIVFLVLFTIGCDKILLGDEERIISLEENLKPPTPLNDGWEVSDLSSENINPLPVQGLIRDLQTESHNIHSLLIFRNNKLVSESYFNGWHRDRLHASRSASKSFISTLVGIAIDKGKISSVHEKVFDFFPQYAGLNNAQKSRIEIQHLLTMTAGLEWDERNSLPGVENDETRIEVSDNRLAYVLGKEVIYSPGSYFEYNSGCPVVEAGILKKATGQDPEDFARENFFTPLGITNYYWRRNADGLITAVGPILLRPRDMAKLGQVFLDSGKWKGQQIVSANWVKDATATFTGNELNATGYGYHWWSVRYTINGRVVRLFFAAGSGGQYIFVAPAFNAVVLFTGGNYPPLFQGAPFGMLANVILPAFL